jgi:hypothetical protein
MVATAAPFVRMGRELISVGYSQGILRANVSRVFFSCLVTVPVPLESIWLGQEQFEVNSPQHAEAKANIIEEEERDRSGRERLIIHCRFGVAGQ